MKDAFEPNIILNHFGKPQELEWAHISQHYFSDIDGRSTEKMLSTPGGDLGEFLLAVSVFEDTTKTGLNANHFSPYPNPKSHRVHMHHKSGMLSLFLI